MSVLFFSPKQQIVTTVCTCRLRHFHLIYVNHCFLWLYSEQCLFFKISLIYLLMVQYNQFTRSLERFGPTVYSTKSSLALKFKFGPLYFFTSPCQKILSTFFIKIHKIVGRNSRSLINLLFHWIPVSEQNQIYLFKCQNILCLNVKRKHRSSFVSLILFW